jgi:osmotically-inducible protein OsmY
MSRKEFGMPVIASAGSIARSSADDRLANLVLSAVRARCGRSVANFSPTARQGVVTLHGLVRSFYQKQVMLNAVLAVPGVEQILDQVEVVPLEPVCPGALPENEIHSAA